MSKTEAGPWSTSVAMGFDSKIAVIVRDDLAVWQKLNVACFLSGGAVGSSLEVSGEPYRDGSGTVYGPLIRQPVMVFEACRCIGDV